jgi:hypothetical protein
MSSQKVEVPAPKLSKGERMASATNEAAREIIEHEKQEREVKTDRLRQARLSAEASAPAPPKPVAKSSKRRR